ncbi:MAG: P1 family peptidase [bacterium]|nr:P1 family peptidase [bacterium]
MRRLHAALLTCTVLMTFPVLSRPASAGLDAVVTPPGLAPGRARLRDLGIRIGRGTPGRFNAITDVPGVKVGHVTLVAGDGPLVPGQGPVRTGVTAIVPREDVWRNKCFAAGHVFNGNGEVTGLHWVNESGHLETPILLTDTLSVGRVADSVVSWMCRQYPDMGRLSDTVLPVVAECDDQFLNDQQGRHVGPEHVFAAIDGATSGPVAEGCVGAGTGMVAYRFKSGIGTASRVLPVKTGGYTVGVLVNANMAPRPELRIAGVPVGELITDLMPQLKPSEGSIIMVVATDAPLLPHQLARVAKRAIMGLSRTGSTGRNSSGDFVLAFSTANTWTENEDATQSVQAAHGDVLDGVFDSAVEATEEAIGNALTAATTTRGWDGHTVHALPLDRLKSLVRKYRPAN